MLPQNGVQVEPFAYATGMLPTDLPKARMSEVSSMEGSITFPQTGASMLTELKPFTAGEGAAFATART